MTSRLRGLYPDGEIRCMSLMVFGKLGGLSTTDVLMGKCEELSQGVKDTIEKAFERLAKYEPVQYVTGEADFCGMIIKVGEGVLIPRPETEELVRLAVEKLGASGVMSPCVLDIGTGSGCIAVVLSKLLKSACVEAWDVSERALALAVENAERLGACVTFRKVDALEPLPESFAKRSFDLIVSNPPYICEREKENMERNVLDYEPGLALFVPDDDPLLFYRAITGKASRMLRDGGFLMFETNREYASGVAAEMRGQGFSEVEIKRDFMGNERMVAGVLRLLKE